MAFAPMSVGSGILSLEAQIRWVEETRQQLGEGCGAIASFLGVVRRTHQGRQVRFLEYEAHERLALNVFEAIAVEINESWPSAVVSIHHRVGRIEIGGTSVAIAAAAAHRAEAFQVCRYAIERVKQIAPIWKHEFFEDGDAWVEGPIADPDDATMREQAKASCA